MFHKLLIAVASLALLAAACGDDGPQSVTITGIDYAYEDVPETLAVGSDLTFHNGAEDEVHEMVVMKISDGETRSVEELLALPEEETAAIATFVGVSVALPGEDGIVVEGSDPITLDEAGRYVVLCFLPVGSDVEAARELLSGPIPESDGPPPSFGDGPPHVTAGMFAEITVE